MKLNTLILFLNLIIASVYSQNNKSESIEDLFKKELEKKNIYNAYLNVYSKSKAIHISLNGGTFTNGKRITTANPFYTASIGKMFTATAIAILKEKHVLDFNDAISLYLTKEVLSGLHVFNGKEYSNKITIGQLLQHTSGLPDYFEDTTLDGTPNMIQQIFIQPNKTTTSIENISFTKQKMKPLFIPGKGFHYTDTAYNLLGLIIEKVSGKPLHKFFKENIFIPLKMKHTYINLQSKPIDESLKMAEIYVENLEISNYKSLSADWAGGGIVSTSKDLILFQEALFTYKLVNKETLQKMQHWIPETHGMEYGFGLRKITLNQLDPTLPELEIIGHSGSTGSFVYYCKKLDTYISGTLNQVSAKKNALVFISAILKSIQQN